MWHKPGVDFSRRLTLVAAPAGYGKTALLCEWISHLEIPAAWITFDEADNDLGRFLQYLIASLQTISPGIGETILAGFQYPQFSFTQPSISYAMTTLVNEIAAIPRPFILVFDDYHTLEDQAIHPAVAFLLDHMPEKLSLVISTRADPPLSLSRLRARGQLVEIRADDLRFSEREAEIYLRQVMHLNLENTEIAILAERTEGWIAGLQMAALALQERLDTAGFIREFSGRERFVIDYLFEEVLSRQPDYLQVFLIQTSILERLSGPLCDAVLGRPDVVDASLHLAPGSPPKSGQQILEYLEHTNLFLVPLDNERCYYRYHHLFKDLLRHRLNCSYANLISCLHSRAAEWFDVNGFLDAAISHALEAKDFERAAHLFCRDRLEITYTRSISMLDKWLQAFPEAFLRANPWLCIAKAHILWSTGRRDVMNPYVTCTEQALAQMLEADRISESDPDLLILRGDTYSFQAMIALQDNQLDSALEFAKKAVDIIPQMARSRVFALDSLISAYFSLGDIDQAIETCVETTEAGRALNYPSMHMSSTYTLARMLRMQGRLQRAAQALREGLEFAEHHGQARLFQCGILHIGLAETMYEWNALDEMDNEIETGLALSRQGGISALVINSLFTQALLRRGRGDLPGALKTLEEIERNIKDMDARIYLNDCVGLRLQWQAEQGNLAGLLDWINRVDLNVERNINPDRFFQLYQASRFLFMLDRCEEALTVLDKLNGITQEAGYLGWLIHVLVLQSVAWEKKRDEIRALDCLRDALALAQPEGYMRVFLNEGEPGRSLLINYRMQIAQKSMAGDPASLRLLTYVDKLLSAFPGLTPEVPIKPPSVSPAPLALIDPLTDRELEILQLINAGLSNKEIAEKLVISVGTVKAHTYSIYRKLDVEGRTKALVKAREIHLL